MGINQLGQDIGPICRDVLVVSCTVDRDSNVLHRNSSNTRSKVAVGADVPTTSGGSGDRLPAATV